MARKVLKLNGAYIVVESRGCTKVIKTYVSKFDGTEETKIVEVALTYDERQILIEMLN